MYAAIDLLELGILPPRWTEEIVAVVNELSIDTFLDGESATSLEGPGSNGTILRVVTGDVIHRTLAWLYKLYANELLDLANAHFRNNYVVSAQTVSAVNINALKGIGSRYEWHVDSNPLTGVLFVTEHLDGEGGELLFKKGRLSRRVRPRKGVFLLFDARNKPHTVLPLNTDTTRISIPMNFYLAGQIQERPDDLDQYLYPEN